MDGKRFSLLQLGDTFFPIGIFNFSQALESMVQDGFVHDEQTLSQYLADMMAQVAWTDGIALLNAHDAAGRQDAETLVAIDAELLAVKLGQESRTMSVKTGRQLMRVGETLWPEGLADLQRLSREGRVVPTYPVSLGVVLKAAGLDRSDAFELEMYSTASCACGAALRLMRVDHIQMQRLLLKANDWSQALYKQCADRALPDMRTFGPVIEIEGMRHEHADVRMFAN